MGEELEHEKKLEKEIEKEVEAELLEKLEEEMKELAVPVATTPPEHTKLLERLNDMDHRVEFVAGELWQRQGEKLGFLAGLLYGALIGIVAYVFFMI
jgi:N5-methyltetrahydromethanopterin:coenzyme M methyltransferase subunit G